jgi:hypothetical protein
MRDFLKRRVGRPSVGWLWVVALLALPDCTFNAGGVGSGPNLYPGTAPHNSAIFCDIEKESGRHCATATDMAMGIRFSAAAVALNTGQTSTIGLDDSPEALARCGGDPEAVTFQGAFPEGLGVCVNCLEVVGTVSYPTANDACVAKCEDFFGVVNSDGSLTPDNPPDPSVATFCASHAKASTNAPGDGCFGAACSAEGALRMDFADPRRIPEPISWTDLNGVSASGGSLTRTALTSPPVSNPPFDAGAASAQWIARGDAFVEFSGNESGKSHVLGVSEIPSGCPSPCPDTDPSLNDIGFSVSLNRDGRFYVIESGVLIAGPDVGGSFGTYAAGERFRVRLTDNHDSTTTVPGTATITYSRVIGSCDPGTPCPETVFYTHTGAPPHYPLRADASFREHGATLSDVRVVRIK